MEKVLRLILYPSIFFLGIWNGLHSGAVHSPTFKSLDERLEPDPIVFFDNADVFNLIKEDSLCIEEENSTERQEDRNDDGGSVDLCQRIQPKLPVSFICVRRMHTSVPSLPLTGNLTPIYLLNRVFRI